jgi:hypothetical protein
MSSLRDTTPAGFQPFRHGYKKLYSSRHIEKGMIYKQG